MKVIKAFIAALLMLAAISAPAATHPGIAVEGVQTPAWVEHVNGSREPLAVGMTLNNKDTVSTGPDARALLRVADGSLIKLGENGLLALDDIDQKKTQRNAVVTATLDVLSGAFRFTTEAVYRFSGERDVKIKIDTVTAGVRGTDVWGKADKTRDIVCLIEGKITVTHAQNAFTMDQPLSFYIAPENGPAQAVAPVPQQQLAQWARETDIAPGAGAMRKGGQWKVYLGEAGNQDDALDIYDRLRGAGYAVQIRPVNSATGYVYRIRIANLPSKQEAEALAAKLKSTMGITGPRISKV